MNAASVSLYRDQLAQAAQFIDERDDFLVVSHIQPDGDAASSTLAMGRMLRSLGKQYLMINEGPVPSKFGILWSASDIVNNSKGEVSRTFSNVISVDCADYSRIGDVRKLFSPDVALLNIDHHPTNDRFGQVNLVKDDAAATVEILYDLAIQMRQQKSREWCECIYAGLLTDTGGFRYSNTSPHVMKIASEMLEHGVEGSVLAEKFLETLTPTHILLLRRALSRLAFAADRRIAWMSVTAEDIVESGASSDDMEGLVNYPRNIEGVEVGILFKEAVPGRYKVSLRSAGKVNVAALAKKYGGGGHVRASGCTLEGSLDEVSAAIVEEVGRWLP